MFSRCHKFIVPVSSLTVEAYNEGSEIQLVIILEIVRECLEWQNHIEIKKTARAPLRRIFVVRLANGLMLILEIKGIEDEQDRAKHQAAQRWVAAVNHWG